MKHNIIHIHITNITIIHNQYNMTHTTSHSSHTKLTVLRITCNNLIIQ